MLKRFVADYWRALATPAPLSIAVCRMCLAVSAGWMTWHLRPSVLATIYPTFVPGFYSPLGIAALLGDQPPPFALVTACWWIANAAVVSLFLGLYPRVACAVWTICGLVCAGLEMARADHPSWHHGYNIVFVAALCFLAARSDAVLAMTWSSRRRAQTPSPSLMLTRVPIVAVQFAIVLVFADAAACKLAMGGHLWIISDNMRNLLRMQYLAIDETFPWYLVPITNHPWMWKGLAIGNFVGQLTPSLSLLFIQRPLLRAALGAFFLVEILGLHVVMGFPNWQWAPLFAFFVDWEALAAWLRRKGFALDFARAAESLRASLPGDARPNGWLVWIAAVTALNFVAAGTPQPILSRINAYPFTCYPLYCIAFINEKTAEHRDYVLTYTRWSLAGSELDAATRRAIEHRLNTEYYKLQDPTDQAAISAALQGGRKLLRELWPGIDYGRPKFFLVEFVVPAYPALSTPIERSRLLLGEVAESHASE